MPAKIGRPRTRPPQQYARAAVANAIANGTLVRPAYCEKCGRSWPTLSGRPGIQAHHHKGYDFPLDVVWLCIPCHRDADGLRFTGETNGRATLTDEQVEEIRARSAKGEVGMALAKEFKVSKRTIYNYIQRVVRR